MRVQTFQRLNSLATVMNTLKTSNTSWNQLSAWFIIRTNTRNCIWGGCVWNSEIVTNTTGLMRPKSEAHFTYRPVNFAKFCGLKLQSWTRMVTSDAYALGITIICGHGWGGWERWQSSTTHNKFGKSVFQDCTVPSLIYDQNILIMISKVLNVKVKMIFWNYW